MLFKMEYKVYCFKNYSNANISNETHGNLV